MKSEDEGTASSIVKLLSGETLLTLQVVGEGEKNSTMAVYVGSEDGKYFTHVTYPFSMDKKLPCVCNSIYVRGRDNVTAVTSTSIDGQQGIWLIDGKLLRD